MNMFLYHVSVRVLADAPSMTNSLSSVPVALIVVLTSSLRTAVGNQLVDHPPLGVHTSGFLAHARDGRLTGLRDEAPVLGAIIQRFGTTIRPMGSSFSSSRETRNHPAASPGK